MSDTRTQIQEAQRISEILPTYIIFKLKKIKDNVLKEVRVEVGTTSLERNKDKNYIPHFLKSHESKTVE